MSNFVKILSVLAVVYSAAFMVFFPKWTVDDAYIAFRYSANLAESGELTWNVGGEKVAGYSDFAWIVLIAGFMKAGVSPLFASKALGIAAYFGGFLFLVLLAKRLKIHGTAAAILALAYATLPQFFTHAVGSLETTLFVSSIIFSLYCLIRVLDSSGRAWQYALLLALLFTSLVRPEGIALSLAALAGVLVFFISRRDRQARLFLGRAGAVYGLPLAVYFVWVFQYYGFLLPNSFYVKTISGFTASNLVDFARFASRFVFAFAAAAIMPVLAETDLVWKKLTGERGWTKGPLAVFVGVTLLFAAALLFEFSRSHLIMNYAYRFYMPLLPLIWLWLGLIATAGWRAVLASRKEYPVRFAALLSATVLLVVFQVAFNVFKLGEEIAFARDEKIMLEAEHISIGNDLKAIIPRREWLAVYIDAGAIPYFSGLPTLDFGNLNDVTLAHGNLRLSERVDYLYRHNPGAIVFTSENAETVEYGPETAAVLADPRFENYVLFKRYLSPFSPPRPYHEFVYLRRDLLPEPGGV